VASKKSTDREAREARERLRRYNARQAVHENQKKRRTRDNIVAVVGVVAIAAAATGLQLFYFNGGPGTPSPAPSASESLPPVGQNVGNVPEPGFAEGKTYTGSLVLNETITLGVTLDAALAPQAVSSILADTLTGYYVGKSCHRLVSSETAQLLQCGSLDGTGASDPEYSYGPIENAPADNVYPAGTIAIARTGDNAYGNGRQFFIVTKDTILPADTAGGYSVVGRVTSGLEALIAEVMDAGTADGSPDAGPLVATTITSFTIQ
jgi:peptidyl-prolyl cis-trans isomerase B (cyclophilin B)